MRGFNREMDRFSALVIYLSLIAIAEDSSLWETCKANEENKLLIGSNDYRYFSTSDVYLRLRGKFHNEKISRCTQ